MHPYDGAVLGPSPFSKYCHLGFGEEQRLYIPPVKFPDTCQQQRVQAAPASTRRGSRSAFAACVLLLCCVGALALGDIVGPHKAYMHRFTTVVHWTGSKGPHNQVHQPHLMAAMPKELRRLGPDPQQLHMHSTVRLAMVDQAKWAALQQAAAAALRPPQQQQQQQQPLDRRRQPHPAHHWMQQQQQDSSGHQQQQAQQVQAPEQTGGLPRRQQLRRMAY